MCLSNFSFKEAQTRALNAFLNLQHPLHRGFKAHERKKKAYSGHLLRENAFERDCTSLNVLFTFKIPNKLKLLQKFQVINHHLLNSLNFNSNSHLNQTRGQATEKSLLPKT